MIAVVHLVWGPLGRDPLREFLNSYRAHGAGAEHELVLLLNQVAPAERSCLQRELGEIGHRLLDVGAGMQDLAAYARALEQLNHDRICFLNSYATLLADDWLVKLDAALDEPRAGIVGPAGSWMSLQSLQLHIHRLPNPYRGVLPEPKRTLEQFAAIDLEAVRERGGVAGGPGERGFVNAVVATLKSLPSAFGQVVQFPPFPAMHVRTNAFMGERELLRQLGMRSATSKPNAYRLESGRLSLTRQIQQRGLQALVVDCDGNTHQPQDWPQSNTFWQGDQEKLLVGDKQTRLYQAAAGERRHLLSTLAWGARADSGH